LAFIRPLELSLLQPLPFDPPVLDLGCGNGYFSKSLSLPFPNVFGLDLSHGALIESKSLGSFQGVVNAKAESMPFRSGQFGTVLCNSSLEHIKELDQSLSEIHRILKPKGIFYLTLPGKRFGEMLFGSDLFQSIGFFRLSKWYGEWFSKHAKHYHIYDRDTWFEILSEHSFSIKESRDYFHRPGMHAFDLSHYYGIFSLLVKKCFGQWRLFPQKWNWVPMTEYILNRVQQELPEEGAHYFFSCTKC